MWTLMNADACPQQWCLNLDLGGSVLKVKQLWLRYGVIITVVYLEKKPSSYIVFAPACSQNAWMWQCWSSPSELQGVAVLSQFAPEKPSWQDPLRHTPALPGRLSHTPWTQRHSEDTHSTVNVTPGFAAAGLTQTEGHFCVSCDLSSTYFLLSLCMWWT